MSKTAVTRITHSFVAGTVVEAARKHGFTDVTALAPWQEAETGGVTITAAPAKHGVYEVTFSPRNQRPHHRARHPNRAVTP